RSIPTRAGASRRARATAFSASRVSSARTASRRPSARAAGRTSRRRAASWPRRDPQPDVPGFGVIVNPHARGNPNGLAQRAELVVDLVGRDGVVRVTESLEAIEDVAREFRERKVDILAVCGGDGSYHCTLSGFCKIYGQDRLPALLPLRAGTINYIANAIGE